MAGVLLDSVYILDTILRRFQEEKAYFPCAFNQGNYCPKFDRESLKVCKQKQRDFHPHNKSDVHQALKL